MPCTAAVNVTVDIAVTRIQPSAKATFSIESVTPSNARVGIDTSTGDIDLSNYSDCIGVTMKFTSQNTFYRQYGGHPVRLVKDALSFSDAPTGPKNPVLPPKHHQFSPLPFARRNNNQTITFTYRNTDCVSAKSRYGIYIADMSGSYLAELDPIVSNGGNSDGFHRVCAMGHARRHHH